MVYNRVNKWSFCFEFLEADVNHLLTLDFVFKCLFYFKISFSLQKEEYINIKEGKSGPLIDPTKGKMWTTD